MLINVKKINKHYYKNKSDV